MKFKLALDLDQLLHWNAPRAIIHQYQESIYNIDRSQISAQHVHFWHFRCIFDEFLYRQKITPEKYIYSSISLKYSF